VGLLEGFFVKRLAALTEEDCGKLLEGYQPAAYGNDLFSERRRALEGQAKDVCSDREQASAYAQYRDIAKRFNRELAGRYPFSDPQSEDASPAAVKSFFVDYESQREDLRDAVAGLKGSLGKEVKKFVGELDAAAAFFRSSLAAGDLSQPLKVDVAFRALPAQSPGSEQVIEWQLRAGERLARYPAGPASLDYAFGAPVALELLWASQSSYRPAPQASQPDLRVRDASAVFLAQGAWALLRLAEAHRPRSVPSDDPLDPNRALLEFSVALASKPGTARMYLALHFSGRDPKTQAPAAVRMPAAFPRSAPVTW
jgi:type VI secretion system protein ImpL